MRQCAPVSNNSETFMFPKTHQNLDISDCRAESVEHALPDPGQISQVENVMELGRRR